MTGVDGDKRALRALVTERLAEAGEASRRQWSERISERLRSWPPTRDAALPMVYLSTPDEVGIDPYIEDRLDRGRPVCGPRVDWATWAMRARMIEDLDSGVEVTRYGIREPVAGSAEADPGAIDVIIVPGVAFDACGHRVGRGAGCYDRFLARNDLMEGVLAVGVCFEAQLVEAVPAEAHDQRLSAIVTERRIIEPM